MGKKEEEPPPPPPPPEDSENEKQWDKVAYSVVIDMVKGLTLGIIGSFLISSKKTALASGLAFGAGQGYADFVQEFKYNDEKRKQEKEKQEEEMLKQQEEEEEKRKQEEEKKKKK